MSDPSIDWFELDPVKLIPNSVVDVINAGADVLKTVSQYVSLVADQAEIALGMLSEDISLTEKALEEAYKQLDGMVHSLLDIGAKYTYIIPGSIREARPPLELLTKLSESYKDEGDPNRPYNTVPVSYMLFVLVVSASDFALLRNRIDTVVKLFTTPLYPSSGTKYQQRGHGEPPNWSNASLSALGYVGEVVRYVDSLKGLAQPTKRRIDRYKSLVNLAKKRVEKIDSTISGILANLQTLKGVLNSIPELGLLKITNIGTSEDEAKAVNSSKRILEYPFDPTDKYGALFALHLQAPEEQSFAALVELFS